MSNNFGQKNIECRIITLGNTGVGKTSIIRRFLEDKYDNSCTSTIGIECSFKKITLEEENVEIKLKLIDTCGQEKYRAINKTYLKNTDGVLFVFALNNKVSLESLKDWIELFNDNVTDLNIIKYLVGNKCDTEKEIEENEIKKFSELYDMKYFKTSAIDNLYINELFQDIGKNFYEKYKDSGLAQGIQLKKKGKVIEKNKCC